MEDSLEQKQNWVHTEQLRSLDDLPAVLLLTIGVYQVDLIVLLGKAAKNN